MAKVDIINQKSQYKGFKRLGFEIRKNKYVYILFIPVFLWYFIFHYLPMYGVVIAFKDYDISLGVWAPLISPWAGMYGFGNFYEFFSSHFFWRLIRNTFLLNFYQLIFSFPAPIILALLLNEIKDGLFKRSVQTISYLPHFVSTIVICGMLYDFLQYEKSTGGGLINQIIAKFGITPKTWLLETGAWRTIYIGSGIWKGLGWGSIIYLAALSNVDLQLYDAAIVDGASRFQRAWHVTIPCIIPTIVILLIMNLGRFASEGPEKTILLYNPVIYETADIVSSYVYRRGIQGAQYSFATAVGLFNSVINICLLTTANAISRRVSENSLW